MANAILVENLNEDGLKTLMKSTVREAIREELKANLLPKESRYLTRREICQRYHVSFPTVDKAIDEGRLTAYRIGGRILFREDELVLEKITVVKRRG